ncbi:MAG: alpha/beta hydrolase [Egibacteraceae bacterium]
MPYFTTSDGASLHYEDTGSGKPLVLLPGWGCSPAFFIRNTGPLAERMRVVGLAYRGHGDSENTPHGHRIARYAADVRDLVEHLGLEDATLLGWSMGAAVIWSHVELFGEAYAKRMVIVDQSPRQYYVPGSQEWQGVQVGCFDAESLAGLTTTLALDPRAMAEGIVSACFPEGVEPSAEEVAFFAGEVDKTPGWVRAQIMADHTNLDWRDLLPRITMPALVIIGEKSLIWGPGGAEFPAEHIPGAQVARFADSGHMPFYHEAERFNAVVTDFVLG